MRLPEDLLNPIDGPNPSGVNLRYDTIYDKVKDARREEGQPPPGMTEKDRKVADNALVIKFTTELLSSKTKDLQLAAWLAEALLKERGFGGLRQGLSVYSGLIENFWDTIYPEIEDGDPQARAASLGFIATKLEIPLKLTPVVEKAAYGLLDYRQARELGYEDQAKTDEAKKKRAQLVKEGKLTPEIFDKAFEETSKRFYAQSEKDLDACLGILAQLKAFCDPKFGEDGPSFTPLHSALEAARHLVHGFLEKKREREPDPMEETASNLGSVASSGSVAASLAMVPPQTGILISVDASSEPADRVEAIRAVAEAAALLRQREPRSPASYLMMRGLRWGELRAAVDNADPAQLEAPPTELRKHLKRLALDRRWEELLDAAESAMALPCSRAWLDLQRYVVEACTALGSAYDAIGRAILADLKALLSDIPELLEASLTDETPVANSETRSWLESLAAGDLPVPSIAQSPAGTSAGSGGAASRWPARTPDVRSTVLQMLRDGQQRKAFELLQQDIIRQRSGRERFRCKMQLVEICASTGNQNIAQPVLDDLMAAIETHKLDEWEDQELVADALATILKLSQRIQADKAQQQKLFERICRLNPAHALGDVK